LLGPKFPNVAEEDGRLYVRSTHTDFSEELVTRDGESWRPWDARRSKVAAAIVKRSSQLGIREGDTVLYLGAAHGYTPSFIADVVSDRGTVFCLDFSANVVRDLLRKSRARPNMIPLLADARKLDEYSWRVTGADCIVMDVAQKDQATIFLNACKRFLAPGGFGILALKARSVDMTRDPRDVFRDTYRMLETHVKVVDYRELGPFEKDHAVFIIKNDAPAPGTPSAFPERNEKPRETNWRERKERTVEKSTPWRERRDKWRAQTQGNAQGTAPRGERTRGGRR
jgi:fibrillarin-like pre-rRNA processing protein